MHDDHIIWNTHYSWRHMCYVYVLSVCDYEFIVFIVIVVGWFENSSYNNTVYIAFISTGRFVVAVVFVLLFFEFYFTSLYSTFRLKCCELYSTKIWDDKNWFSCDLTFGTKTSNLLNQFFSYIFFFLVGRLVDFIVVDSINYKKKPNKIQEFFKSVLIWESNITHFFLPVTIITTRTTSNTIIPWTKVIIIS